MRFEIKVQLSKRFPDGVASVIFGRYTITAIPVEKAIGAEAVLAFEDNQGGARHPIGEADIACRLLSLVMNARVKRSGVRIDVKGITEDAEVLQYDDFLRDFEPGDLNFYMGATLSMDENLARQFIRAANPYSFALEFIPSDPTFSFFLLAVAVECILSQEVVIPHHELDKDAKKCERFCLFITTYLLDDHRTEDERDDKLFRELLKTVYYSHRSAFVHGGKEVSGAAIQADKAHSSYFKHATEGREVKTPGLAWFAHVVRGSLLGFLRTHATEWGAPDEDLLARLALEKAMLKVKALKAIREGQEVRFDDIDYR